MFGIELPVYGWLTRQIYGFSPFVAFLMVFTMTIVMTSALQLVFDGRVVPLRNQYLGFIIGDVLLALIAALATRITQQDPAAAVHSTTYWSWWALGGILGALLFIGGEYAQGKLHTIRDLLTSPPLIWHHIGLFGLLIPVLGGVIIPLLVSHWRNWEIVAIIVLFVIYLGLQLLDGRHRPEPAPPAPGSFTAWIQSAAR